MFRTGVQMLLLVLLVGLFLLRETQQWPGEAVDQRWTDWLSLNCGKPSPTKTPPVALIAIDDTSLSTHPWPWTPLDFSLFYQAALPFKPEVLGIEEILEWDQAAIAPEDRQKLPQYERILKDVLLMCPKPLVGSRLGTPEDPQAIPPIEEVPTFRNVRGSSRQIPEFITIERQPKEEYRLSAALGFVNIPPSRFPTSMIPLVLKYRGQVVPTFTLQAAILWSQISADDVVVVPGSHIALGKKLRIPINDRGEMRINWGVPRTVFSFDDLLLSAEQMAAKTQMAIPAERLAGSVTFLGRTDEEARTVPIPLQPNISPSECFASAIGTIQSEWFIVNPPYWATWAIVGFAALISIGVPRWRKWKVALGTLLILVIYFGASLVWFEQSLMPLPALLPLGLAVFIVLYRTVTPDWAVKPKRPVLL
jgi:hypothetical protein